MNKYIIFLLAISIYFSCNNSKSSNTEKVDCSVITKVKLRNEHFAELNSKLLWKIFQFEKFEDEKNQNRFIDSVQNIHISLDRVLKYLDAELHNIESNNAELTLLQKNYYKEGDRFILFITQFGFEEEKMKQLWYEIYNPLLVNDNCKKQYFIEELKGIVYFCGVKSYSTLVINEGSNSLQREN